MSEAHIHLILTHVPVMAALFGLVLLTYGYFRKQATPANFSYGFFVVAMVSAVVVYLTGEAAEEAIEGIAGTSEAIIERHEEFAVFALAGAVLLGSLALGALFLTKRGVPRAYAGAVLVVAFVVNVLMAWTANLGGQISHPEIRSAQETVSDRTYEREAAHTD